MSEINQTRCLVGSKGWQHMRGHYDPLPREVRLRLQSSTFNLCAACIGDAYQVERSRGIDKPDYFKIIEDMEAQLACSS